jgi:hypothetical protein
MKKTILALAVLLLPLSGFIGNVGASTANLVQNGNFETGNSQNWSLNGSLQFICSPTAGTASQGNFAWQFDAYTSSPASLSQSISTIAGQEYNLTFDSSVIGGAGNFLSVSIGDQILYSLANSPNYGWTTSSFNFTADQSNQNLVIRGASDPLWVEVDNISVTAVPETSTYALFGLGAFGMLMAIRRKKTA